MSGEHQHGDYQRKLNDGEISQNGSNNRGQREGGQRGQGRLARGCRHGQPDRAGGQPDRPGGGDQHAIGGGGALATLEAQPDGEAVANDRADAGPQHRLGSAEPCREQDGGGALQPVQQQRRGCDGLVAGAQDVGRADVAGTDASDVAPGGGLGKQQTARDGAEQVAQQGEYGEGH